ncbi:hypothetical protein Tco_0407788 [Tanacetum coccineum]
MINEVTYIGAKVAGRKVLVSKASIRADLLFNDEDGTECFTNQVLTFMSKTSPKFSRKITPLTPHMPEVAAAIGVEYSMYDGDHEPTPSPSNQSMANADREEEDSSRQVMDDRSDFPNDYTPTDEVQTSREDEGIQDLYGLNKEVLRLKKENAKQAYDILKLKAKIKKLVKMVKPVVTHHRAFLKSQAFLSRKKKLEKKQKKKSSSFKQGRKISESKSSLNEDNEENEVKEENDINWDANDDQAADLMDVEDTTPAKTSKIARNEKQSDETEQVDLGSENLHKGIRSEDTVMIEEIHDTKVDEVNLSTAGLIIQVMEDEAVNISRPRRGVGITIPCNVPEQESCESPTPSVLDPKDKELARRIQVKWEEEEERKRLAGLESLQAELEANEMNVAEIQRAKRENLIEEQKAKFLVETIAA